MPKIIIDTASSSHKNAQDPEAEQIPCPPSLQNSFVFHFQEFSFNLYIFSARDLDHELALEMTLELKETFAFLDEENEAEPYFVPVITCHFPGMNVQAFNKKVEWDNYLQGILMFQFQLKVLEQLFLFCEEKNAVSLILAIHESDLDYLEIYRRFFVSEERVMTAKGEQTRIVIPTDVETYDKVIDFMDEVDRDFHQTLWRGQNVNPVFRQYIKRHSLSLSQDQ